MIVVIYLWFCLIMVNIICGFVMNLPTSNVVTTVVTTKTTIKSDIGYLSSFELTFVNNADGSKLKTSKNTYKQSNNGITIYTIITENVFIPCPTYIS